MKHKPNKVAAKSSQLNNKNQASKPKTKIELRPALALMLLVGVMAFIGGTRSQDIKSSLGSIFNVKTEVRGPLSDRQLQKAFRELQANYDGQLDRQALSEGAVQGMVKAVGDPYTEFLDKKSAAEFEDSLSGRVGGGVGIEISLRNQQPTVVRTLPDNPAEKAGVKAGDVIVAINDEVVDSKSIDIVAARIRGEVGTSVVLSLERDGRVKDYTMDRQEVNNPSVVSDIKNEIGLVTLYRFDAETATLVEKAAQKFKDKKVKGVVLDLRNNGGGYLNAAVDVSGVWLDNQLVVSEKTGGRTVEELRSSPGASLKDVPTVVLVNEFSASASEIVAGALKDHQKAILIGEQTFGKGTVQRIIHLSDGALLRVTVARWYTPKGDGINEKGIKPHQIVKNTLKDLDAGRDPQLKAAFKQLNKD